MADRSEARQGQEKIIIVTQGQRGWSFGKVIATIILLLVLGLLASYGLSWANSDVGRQKISDIKYLVLTKYNPVAWYLNTLREARMIGTIWETYPNKTAEKTGVDFQDFEAIGGRILPSGATLIFRYKFDVGEGVSELKISPRCSIAAKDETGREVGDAIKSGPVIIPIEPEVSSDDPLSYLNIICQVETNELNQDRTIEAKGTVSFTQSRQRNSLKVYFTKDTENIGDEFFKAYRLEEKLPIRPMYNNEPVEVGLGVSEKDIQPIVIGRGYFPLLGISLVNRWDGRAKLREMNLYLPEEVKIDSSKSPSSTSCPFKESTSPSRGYIKYEAEKAYLEKLDEFGKGTDIISQSFFCWLKIDESILGRVDYTQDQYSADVSYDYEFQPKSETITLKGIKQKSL